MRYLRLVVLTGILLALSRCGDSEAPPVAGPQFLTVRIDGTTWVPDTASCFVLVTPMGTVSSILASRIVSAEEYEEILILFSGFPAVKQFPLGGIFSKSGIAFFDVFRGNPLPLQYTSMDAQPGLLAITGVSLTDSLVAGGFSFVATATPDTTPHLVVTGQFRIRYEVGDVN